ncbi:hypothetical protein PVN23_21465 [Bacillus licheniformis]|uniref:hypothetical protein n=1 Tax=Bacillus licheniformis TaxID=1402 RepID=UPI00237C5845|nr:hypothetical protein [Bacillus licheniformis]MDE1381178.1 hypothetical protein [Bacillus licheniformis]
MKRIAATDLIVDGKRFKCHEIDDASWSSQEPEMVEVTIKCTITKEHYEKLIEEITLQEYLEGLGL